MANKDYVTITKLVSGALILRFEDVNSYGRVADISFEVTEENKRIPITLAASIFSNPIAIAAYKQGLFKFMTEADYKATYNYAVEIGIVYEEPEQEGTKYTISEIKDFLLKERKKEIQDILDNGGQSQNKLLYETAVSVAPKLTLNFINFLEEKLKLSLTVEGE